MKVCSTNEMRRINERSTNELGISDAVVMENAGLAACVIRREMDEGGKVAILRIDGFLLRVWSSLRPYGL